MILQPVVLFLEAPGPGPVSAAEPDVEPDPEPIQMQQPTLRLPTPLILSVVIACFSLIIYHHGETTTAMSQYLKPAIFKTGASAYRSEFWAKVWRRHAEYLSETYVLEETG
jgi:hypothetical protein